MEFALLTAGLGYLGYYMNQQDKYEPKKPKAKIQVNDIPSGRDIYNNNRLTQSEYKEMLRAEKNYKDSQYTYKTNVVPNYYNQLGPLLDTTQFNNDFGLNKIEGLYDYDIDVDNLEYANFDNFTYKNGNDANLIFNDGVITREISPDQYTNDLDLLAHGELLADKANAATKIKINYDPSNLTNYMNKDNIPSMIEPNYPDLNSYNKNEYNKNQYSNFNGNKSSQSENMNSTNKIKETFGSVTGNEFNFPNSDQSNQSNQLNQLNQLNKSNKLNKCTNGKSNNMVYGKWMSEYQKEQKIVPNDKPEYMSQFDDLTFDNPSFEVPSNTINPSLLDKNKIADMERKISLDGGWSIFKPSDNMTYNVVPPDQLTHDNMYPYYSEKYGYGLDGAENLKQEKLEMFTGSDNTWQHKKEVKPFFRPVADMTYVYGTPVRPEGEDSRYIPSRERRNETLEDPKRITPGVGLNYNDVGTHGFQPYYRVLPKDTNELRVESKPKQTFHWRTIDGIRGKNRPVQAPVISYKPDSYKITSEKDLVPTGGGTIFAPKIKENFVMKETDRSQQLHEYTGGAYNREQQLGQTVPDYMLPKVKYSTKQNFKEQEPEHKYAPGQEPYGDNTNNIKSYNLMETMRSVTSENKYTGGPLYQKKSIYSNMMDTPKNTIRETTSFDNTHLTVLKPNDMRGTVHSYEDIPVTLKDLTIDNPINPNICQANIQQRIYHSDDAKTTTKQTTIDNIVPANLLGPHMRPLFSSQPTNTTTRETTEALQFNTNMLPLNHGLGQVNNGQPTNTTTRETTESLYRNTFMKPLNHGLGQINNGQPTNTTIRETTEAMQFNTNMVPLNHGLGQINNQQPTNTTTRETTETIQWNNFMTPVNQQQGKINNQQPTNTTTRETTETLQFNTNMVPLNHGLGQINNNQPTNTTTRETTETIQWNNFMTPVNQQQGQINNQQPTNTTTRETTEAIQWNNFMTPVNQQQGQINNQQPANTTTRETTEAVHWNNFMTPVNQQQGKINNQQPTNTTTRETTGTIQWNNFMTPVNQQQGKINNQQPTNTTIRETTETIQWNNNMRPLNHGLGQVNNGQPTNTTIRETTETIQWNTNITPINQKQGEINNGQPARTTGKELNIHTKDIGHVYGSEKAGIVNLYDIAKPTIKEQTIETKNILGPTYVNQAGLGGMGHITHPYDAKTTTKEQTIDNKYILGVTKNVNQQGLGYLAEKMEARNTNRQTTQQEPEIFHFFAQDTFRPRLYHDMYNAQIDDRKESLYTFHPTYNGPKEGPSVGDVNISIRDRVNIERAPNLGSATDNSGPYRMDPGLTEVKKLPIISQDLTVDPLVKYALQTNPYHISYPNDVVYM